MAIIDGATRSDSILQAALVIDMEAFSAELEEGTYLFETLSRKMGGGLKTATRMEHKFRERRLIPAVVSVTADAVVAATSIQVSNAGAFHTDQALYCPESDEVFMMNEAIGGTANAGQIAILNKAGSGGLTTAISAGDSIVRLTEAHAEGEAIPAAFATKETELSTYLYQADQTIQVTDIQNAEEHYGQKERNMQRRDAWIDFKRSLNLMLYAGQNTREIVSASGRYRHIMRGLFEWLESNAIDGTELPGGQGLTMRSLGLIVRPTKAFGSSSMVKIGVCGQNAWVGISAFPDQFVQIEPGKDQSWGVTLKRLNTPFGDIQIGYDPMLSDTYGLAGELEVLDPKWIQQLQMSSLPLVMKTNVEDNTDIHNTKDVITGTRGLKVKLPELHRRVYGIQ